MEDFKNTATPNPERMKIIESGLCHDTPGSNFIRQFYKTDFHGESVIFVKVPHDNWFMPKDPSIVKIIYTDSEQLRMSYDYE